MSKYLWNGGDSSFSFATNWTNTDTDLTPAGPPTGGDDFTILSGIAIVSGGITLDNVTAHISGELQILNAATLNLSGAIINAGTFSINSLGNNTSLIIDSSGATFTGSGNVTLSDQSTNLVYGAAASDTLTNVDNTIGGAGALGNGQLSIDNQAQGTIDGSGTNNQLFVETGGSGTLSNEGLIEATTAAGLEIFASNVTNSGIIEAKAGSNLTISDSTITNSVTANSILTKGNIEATGAGANVKLGNSTIIDGGTLTAADGGTIEANVGGTTIDGATIDIDGTSTVEAGNAASLTLGSTVDNSGTFSVDSTGNNTSLIIDSNGATFKGGGNVTLSDQSTNLIYGAAASDTLTNVDNTIGGAGALGNGQLSIDNQAQGTIDGSGTNNQLFVDTGGSGTFSNEGLIEATTAAGLEIFASNVTNSGAIEAKAGSNLTISDSTITNSVTANSILTKGNIEATGAGANVKLGNSTIIDGGTLTATDGGTIEANVGGTTIDGATIDIDATSTVEVGNAASLTLGSTVDNSGTFSVDSIGNNTFLIVDSDGATFKGGGNVTLSDQSTNLIYGAAASDTLTNVDNTISGAGALGNGQLSIDNQAQGTIDGSGTNNQLFVETGGSGTLSNEGLIEATTAAGLEIFASNVTNSGTIEAKAGSNLTISDSTITNSVTANSILTKGNIEATGAGANVKLGNSTIIDGGTLTAADGGTIVANVGGTTIDGATIDIDGTSTVEAGNAASLTLGSTVDNAGTFSVDSTGNNTSLIIDSNGATFTGGGNVTLSDQSTNLVYGAAASDTLTNVDNTIGGAGALGNGQLSIDNQAQGTIDGSGTNNQLFVETGGSGTLSNEGLIEATTAAGLEIFASNVTNSGIIEAKAGSNLTISDSTITNSVTANSILTKGNIEATGAGANVKLGNSTIIDGGTLTAADGGTIEANVGGTTIDGATIDIDGTSTVEAGNAASLTLGSTVDNSGTFSVDSTGNNTSLIIDSNGATFKGGGNVTLSDQSTNLIYGAAASDTLTNVDNIISGAGALGNAQMSIDNQAGGIIEATGANNQLFINPGGSGSLTNDGLIAAVGAAGLLVQTSEIFGAGALAVAPGSLLHVTGAVDAGSLLFAPDPTSISEAVQIDDFAHSAGGTQHQDFNVAIAGFATPDVLKLGGFGVDPTINGTAAPVYDTSTNTTAVSLTDNGTTVGTLTFDGNYSTDTFGVAVDPGNSSLVDVTTSNTTALFSVAQAVELERIGINVACYCSGSMIATDRGDIAVENLRIEDRVVVMSGEARPIKWIGRRNYAGRFIVGRTDMLPICFKANSLGEGLPRRDLWISPHHAMYFDGEHGGVLIEAKDLVNGITIVQAQSVERVEYFHIELETHDVIFAEGARSETFVDDDCRGMFHNAGEYAALYPADPIRPVRFCASRPDTGYEIEAIRQRLAHRAGLMTDRDAGSLRGYIDAVSPRFIEGWAQNLDHPEGPVCLDVYVGGELIGQVLANRYREDLKRAGLGSGHHSFSFAVPDGLTVWPGTIEVRRSLDGAPLASTVIRRTRDVA